MRYFDFMGWFVVRNGESVGPIALIHDVRAGAVSQETLVWREGLDEWVPAGSVSELWPSFHTSTTTGQPSNKGVGLEQEHVQNVARCN